MSDSKTSDECPDQVSVVNPTQTRGDANADTNENLTVAPAVQVPEKAATAEPSDEISEILAAINLDSSGSIPKKAAEGAKSKSHRPKHDLASFAGIFGEEMSPAVSNFNYQTEEKVAPNTLDAATVEGNWVQFYKDQSVDDLMAFAGITESPIELERISKVMKMKFAEEEPSEPGSGLTDKRVDQIETIIKRVKKEMNVDVRFQLLSILMQLLYHFNDESEILCSSDLGLSTTVDHLLDIHLKITVEDPIIIDEFQALMEMSEWVERSLAQLRPVGSYSPRSSGAHAFP